MIDNPFLFNALNGGRGIGNVECEGFNLQKDQDGIRKCAMIVPIHGDER